ncbi:PLC-like phosphodiesterase [Xylona heveae TC161]|uniref:PLC-like phosphodiesterase n=1 Tax=Xylona heveae (strain CBS 132557 / TC161) TaxID=1328760 RepID=A0A165J2L0_XYLHT|nr:PLC-like phosphodiesterase [Xylona heveae TC161]KZF25644.1 PLC-like phosphodiesterase [Xylona heveae TC161]
MLSLARLGFLALLASSAVVKVAADDDSTTSQHSSASRTGSRSIETLTITGTNSPTNIGPDGLPTGSGVSYISYATTVTVPTSTSTSTGTSTFGTLTGSGNSSTSTVVTATSQSVTLLVGGKLTTTAVLNGTLSSNATATMTGNSTSTSTSAAPTNTQPCNGWPEFCERKYSNITQVAAHNSMFDRPGNAASNQALDVLTQLDDGIRMLQGQAHLVNGTMYFCHTNCDILNAGPVEAYLRKVNEWVLTHPYDVVTILLGNGDYVDVGNFSTAFENSGIAKFAYQPPKIPMGIDDWPTLTSMILTGKRVVVFMDYQANQTKVPYILDEFSQMWETPFSPTDRDFPCDLQRPPKLSPDDAKKRMYMANHNLNTEINIATLGVNMLVPSNVLLNVTNNVTGYGSLGLMANSCETQWGRAPNFLLVDYYNVDNGTVFEVAAKHNNVTYSGPCCGLARSAAFRLEGSIFIATVVAATAILALILP